MPFMQVALLHALLDYERRLDDFQKWQTLPYPEALAARLGGRDDSNLPALTFLINQMAEAHGAFDDRARLERRIAILRCIEAVRLYAAAHGGKLPPALADVKEAPVPLDPVSGKAFGYEVKGAMATLSAPAWAEKRDIVIEPLRYQLTMRK
jgi:hypothetical protein